MIKYRVYNVVENKIFDNGYEWLEEVPQLDNVAHIEAGSEPENWEQMTIVDGKLLPASAEVIVERAAAKLKQADKEEMAQIEQFLKNTDWIVVKCVEKNLSVEQVYPTVLALRNEKRERLSILRERYQ